MSQAIKKSKFTSEEELLEGWFQDRPKILGALAQVAQQTLKAKSGISGRRGAYQKAIEVVLGPEAGAEHLEEENFKTLYDNMLSSPFCLGFGAFIQHNWVDLAMLEDEVVMPHREWLEHYANWLNNHWGQKLKIITQGRVDPLIIELDMGGANTEKALPQSPRGLSAQLNKYEVELREMMGISVDEIRGRFKSRVIRYDG